MFYSKFKFKFKSSQVKSSQHDLKSVYIVCVSRLSVVCFQLLSVFFKEDSRETPSRAHSRLTGNQVRGGTAPLTGVGHMWGLINMKNSRPLDLSPLGQGGANLFSRRVPPRSTPRAAGGANRHCRSCRMPGAPARRGPRRARNAPHRNFTLLDSLLDSQVVRKCQVASLM